jgi:short-subunit dehydrogenase
MDKTIIHIALNSSYAGTVISPLSTDMVNKYKRSVGDKSLQQKTIVITGASSGSGRAAALEFAKHKAKLVLAARNIEALNKLVVECGETGAQAIAVQTDVTEANSMKKLAAAANEFGGSIDVWINNAGVLAAGEFTETPVEVHQQVIKTNLIGYINGAHAALPYFKKQRYGVLINNVSVGAWFPVPYAVGYSASKFGLRGFSEALRGELTKHPHIHICDMFPAFLDTPGIQHAANYTGKILRPAPPVYDPQRVARSMVLLARHPEKNVTVGSVAGLLRVAHFLMPGVTNFITSKVMETYFRHADTAPANSGNLFNPVEYGTSIYGGWNTTADIQQRKKTATRVAVIAGLVIGSLIVGRKKFK